MRRHSDLLISKHLLIVPKFLLVPITKSDEQSDPATQPIRALSDKKPYGLRSGTPKLQLSHSGNLIRSYGAKIVQRVVRLSPRLALRRSPEHPQNPR